MWHLFKQLNNYLECGPTIPLLGVYPGRGKARSQAKTSTQRLLATWIGIVKKTGNLTRVHQLANE